MRSAKDLRDNLVRATDGDIGQVKDTLFDDETWTIRYLVVETGDWLGKQQVLISPRSVVDADWQGKRLQVDLTRDQVPHLVAASSQTPTEQKAPGGEPDEGEEHLQSIEAVLGYPIRARDGGIGHVADFLFNPDTWAIQYVVVFTSNWLPGKEVIFAPTWIQKVDRSQEEVEVDLSQDTIRNSPEFSPESLISP